MTHPSPPPVIAPTPSLRELAALFLKLGTIAFGGPAGHLAMMEDELVRRRKWISSADFLDLLAISNILPGPGSTEVALLIGYRLGGFAGLFLAGVCFILPAFVMVAALAWAYVRYGRLPAAAGLLYGIKPVVIAVVIQALWRLGKSAIKTRMLLALAVSALIAAFFGVPPLAILLIAGPASALLRRLQRSTPPRSLAVALPSLSTVAAASVAVSLGAIFLVFLKIGCIVFGSGYVLLAYLRADLVVQHHWLTESQLLDAVAVGQVTPGPVFTTATFIGYLLAGPKGAVVATLGIFAPAFVLVATTGQLARKMRGAPVAATVLDGFNAASLALMAFVTCELGRAAIIDGPTLAIAVVSAIVLLQYRVNSTWLVAAAGALGFALALLGKR